MRPQYVASAKVQPNQQFDHDAGYRGEMSEELILKQNCSQWERPMPKATNSMTSLFQFDALLAPAAPRT
jgi:hypothetical protein